MGGGGGRGRGGGRGLYLMLNTVTTKSEFRSCVKAEVAVLGSPS